MERSEIRDRPINVAPPPPGSAARNPGYSSAAALAAGEWDRENGISSIVI
jgi:hypothetical protein